MANDITANSLMSMGEDEIASLNNMMQSGTLPEVPGGMSVQPASMAPLSSDEEMMAAQNMGQFVVSQPAFTGSQEASAAYQRQNMGVPGADPQQIAAAEAQYAQNNPPSPQKPALQPQDQQAVQQIQQVVRQAGQVQQAQNAMRAEVQRQQYEIQQRILEMDSQVEKVDPDRYWKKQDTGDKIRLGLGMLLAGVGAGLTGQTNVVIDAIEKSIDRDIAAQKVDIESALARKKLAFERMKLQLDQQASMLQDPLKQQQILKVQAEIESIRMATEAKQREMASGRDLDAPTQRSLKETESRYSNVKTNVGRLRQLVDKYGTAESVEPGVEGEMNAIINQLSVDKAKLDDPDGVVRPGEAELVKKSLFEPGYMQRKSSVMRALDAFEKNADVSVKNKLRVLGQDRPATIPGEVGTTPTQRAKEVYGRELTAEEKQRLTQLLKAKQVK